MPKFLLSKSQRKAVSALIKGTMKPIQDKKKFKKTQNMMDVIVEKCEGESNEIIFKRDEYDMISRVMQAAVMQYKIAGKLTPEDKWWNIVVRVKKFFIRRMANHYEDISSDLKIKLDKANPLPQAQQRYKLSKH
ncbi:MAG: hypothetical protein DWQ06_15505 [Calditrichaeota bacterium]|nr:MAG: hypothetical protein DWQ06_15505 [Calditrichota bacterium]